MTVISNVVDATGRLQTRVANLSDRYNRRINLWRTQGDKQLTRATQKMDTAQTILKDQAALAQRRVDTRLTRLRTTLDGLRAHIPKL